jgi:hypothetical protein
LSSFSPLLSQAANNVGPGNSIDFDSNDDRVNLGPILNNLTLFPRFKRAGKSRVGINDTAKK